MPYTLRNNKTPLSRIVVDLSDLYNSCNHSIMNNINIIRRNVLSQ